MSGFEVTGVLLGAIPLLIAALEQYKTTKSKLRGFRYKALYIDRLIAALEEQRVLIESDLRLLLAAVGYEDEYVTALGANTSRAFLESYEISREVGSFLGLNHEPYTKRLENCRSSLEDIAKEIGGLTPASKLDSSDLKELLKANSLENGRFDFRKRIKFSLEKDDLEQRIVALDKSTEMLRRLRVSGQFINDGAVQSTSRAIARFAVFLQKVRDHASMLYSALSRGWVHGCHPEHTTKLYLDSRPAPLQKRRLPIAFKIIFGPNSITCPSTSPRYATEIHVLDDDQDTNSSPHLGSKSLQISHTRNVTIVLPDSQSQEPSPVMVDNICSSMVQAQQANRLLKLYLSSSRGLCSCLLAHNIQTTALAASDTQDVITLNHVLQEPPGPKYAPKKWTCNQRMGLSFKLASSLLQLYSTPWLAMAWNKEAIYFVRTDPPPNAVSTSLFFDADHPFITHTFTEHAIPSSTNKAHAKRPLLELGILLLEIWHEEPFESYAIAKTLVLDESYGRRYDVAREWLDDTAPDILPFYLDAVSRCIECSFSASSSFPDWNNIEFRKSVCEGVVKPLWENCPKT